MTLCAAWIRNIGHHEELVVATDSRVTGGHTWDACPKIIPLKRGDSVLCFAGDTLFSYPMMAQIQNALNSYHKSRDRALDISELKTHIIGVLNSVFMKLGGYVKSEREDLAEPDLSIMLAGWSWRNNSFRVYEISYDAKDKSFRYESARGNRKEQDEGISFYFMGDKVKEAKNRLIALLNEKYPAAKFRFPHLDFEPLQVLIEFSRDPKLQSIGGPPQVVKIYKHANVMPYNVFWPNKENGVLTSFGRPILSYEKIEYLSIDPDTLEIFESEKMNA